MSQTMIAIFLAVLFTATNAVPYSKYGRTCKDIGCRSDEVCVMAEDPCSSYQRDSCGRYPTCQRSSSGGESCTTKICPSGQYCKTENGRPTCVNTTPGLAYDSAGVSAVNGHKIATDNQPSVPADPSAGSRYANTNPYANANAPPASEVNHNQPSYGSNNPPYPTNNNNGYPPYPTNNNNNNNNGYPPYPTHNNGYPPYPTNNNGYPPYPTNNRPSYPDNRYHNTYPQHNLPQHNPGQGSSYSNSILRRNGATNNGVSMVLLIGSFILIALSLRISKA